ncbi:MAG: MFS transporter [Mycobacteriales bacterium]
MAVAGIAVAKAFFVPASTAALPNLVDARDLETANVLTGAAWGSMLALGAAAGGLLAALTSPRVCFVVDAVSFLVSAGLTGFTRRSMQVARPRRRTRLRSDLAEAAAYARHEPRVRTLLFAKSGPALGNGSLTLFPLYATQIFGVGAVGSGLMYAARGLGALVWPLAFGRRLRAPSLLAGTLAGAMVLFGAAYLGVAAAPVFPLMLGLLVVAHMGGGANWTLSTYALQLVVPDEIRGRVFSADVTFATLGIALSQALAGALSGHVPLRALTAGFGGVTLLYGLFWWALARRTGVSAEASPLAAPRAQPVGSEVV